MPNVVIHGVYKIVAPQPCYLLELTIEQSVEKLDFTKVYVEVEIPGGIRNKHRQCRVSRQAPFLQHFLSSDGFTILGDHRYADHHPEIWQGAVRIAFLMHYLSPGDILSTPYGDVELPPWSTCPQRLKSIEYESPY